MREAQITSTFRKRSLQRQPADEFEVPHLVGPPSLHDRLTARLRDIIIEDDLPAGHRLVEADLCRKLGVSRTPLREALKVLAGEGLVTLQANRGASVTELGVDEIRELFVVIAELEALAAALCCERLASDQLARLEVIHRQMIAHHNLGNLHEYFLLNDKIHKSIVLLSGNSILIATHQRLMSRARRTRYQALLVAGRWEKSVAEHEALMEALRRSQGARARAIWRKHVLATGENATQTFSDAATKRTAKGA